MGQSAGGAGTGPGKPQVSSVTSLIGGSLSGVVTAALTQVRGSVCSVGRMRAGLRPSRRTCLRTVPPWQRRDTFLAFPGLYPLTIPPCPAPMYARARLLTCSVPSAPNLNLATVYTPLLVPAAGCVAYRDAAPVQGQDQALLDNKHGAEACRGE